MGQWVVNKRRELLKDEEQIKILLVGAKEVRLQISRQMQNFQLSHI